jgi:hypothetical protein
MPPHETLYIRKLQQTFHDLATWLRMAQQHQQHLDTYRSSQFNIFQYLPKDENALSDYIGMLLDSEGPHGQQNLFLDLFLTYVQHKGLQIPHARYMVHREYTANGRIDLLLTHEDTALIIENKPYAGDLRLQLHRYYMSVQGKYTDVALLYLSRGHDPSAASMPADLLAQLKRQGKFLTLPYADFSADYLRRCYQHCASEKFRFFLSDFMAFLDTRLVKDTRDGQTGND